jgi:hypothetical protein
MSDPIKDPKLISAMQKLGRGLKSPSDLAKLSRELLKIMVEASLNAEMDSHIGYEKHSPDGYNTGNSRNSYNRKTLKGVARHDIWRIFSKYLAQKMRFKCLATNEKGERRLNVSRIEIAVFSTIFLNNPYIAAKEYFYGTHDRAIINIW